MKGNAEYFINLRKYTHDPIVQRTFYDFLMNYETKPVITESDIPKTEFHQKIREASKDTMDAFIEDLVMDNYNKTEVKMSSLEIWDLFRSFCLSSNIDCKMSKQQFSTRIGMRKITGFNNLGPIWYKGKVNRVFSLDIPVLKEHFNIAEPPEFVEIA